MGNVSQKGISYILEDNKFPDFIRNHSLFTSLNKIEKIFPKIGLPNLSEPFYNENDILDVSGIGRTFLSELRYHIQNAINGYGAKAEEREVATLFWKLCLADTSIKIEKNKINLVCPIDFKHELLSLNEGESLFKAYGKLIKACPSLTCLLPLEKLSGFKKFSSNNLPFEEAKICFSSDGRDGAWDIATISMRGISSCQSWGGEHSLGLVGSIASKFVGVLFITNNDNTTHGTKMLRRVVVRYTLHRTTKKPALLMDYIYPYGISGGTKILTFFKDFLQKKTNLPVYYTGEKGFTEYFLPGENPIIPKHKPYCSYMDTKIEYLKPLPVMSNAVFDKLRNIDNTIYYALNDKFNTNNVSIYMRQYVGSLDSFRLSLRAFYQKYFMDYHSIKDVSETCKAVIKKFIFEFNSIYQEYLKTINLPNSWFEKLQNKYGAEFDEFMKKYNSELKSILIKEFKKFTK